jgi:two-component sensor histidine kinase
VKYGSLSVPAGRIEVSWRLEASGEARRLVLTWAEAGGPQIQPPKTQGFGCQLIERSIAHELGGAVWLEFPLEGVRCRIEVPLEAAPPGP